MQKTVSSQVSAVARTEADAARQPAQTGPIELDFSVLSQVGGAGPHGSWAVTTSLTAAVVSGPHGSW